MKRAVAGSTALLAGCMESSEAQVQSAFEVDASCTAAQTKVQRKWEGRYEASGCGSFRAYYCSGEIGCRPYTGVPALTSDDVVGEGKLFYSATLEPDALQPLAPARCGDAVKSARLAGTVFRLARPRPAHTERLPPGNRVGGRAS